MFAAAKNLGDGAGGMGDLLTRLRAREKARHGLQAKKDLDSSGLPIMTAAAIRQVAIDDEGYETPELNDRLYLHFKGYRKIQNLEPYTSLKALWLGGNGLSEIQGISHLSQLRCLYLERNLISTIKGLEGLDNLVQLDLSQNCIETTLGLRCLPALHTLNLSKNALKDADSVSPLSECSSLTNLDVTANKLAGPGVLDVLSSLKRLVSLSLSGNPILAETAHFRKTVITASPKLRYLDRPVFQAERVAAAAWTVGGAEAEREARTRYQEEKRNEDRKQMQVFRDWQAEMRQKKLAEIEARAAAGLGPPEPSPEEIRRVEERAAKAKADASEDKRLINEVGLCKIADAFYASEGKGESRRSAMDTLGRGGSLAGAKGSHEPAGGSDAPGKGHGDVDGDEEAEEEEEEEQEREQEEAKQAVSVLSAQFVQEACGGASVQGEATGTSRERLSLAAEGGTPVAAGSSSSTATDEADEVGPSIFAPAAGDTVPALKERATSSHEGTAGEDAESSEKDSIPNNTTGANASAETRGSDGGDDHATSAASSSDVAPISTGGGGNGGNGGGGGDSEHEHKEGGVDKDNVSDESSDREQGEEKGEGPVRECEDQDEEKEENGQKENQSQQQAEDEERVRRVRVAQSLAMYRAQLAAERRLEEANALGADEEKTGVGVGGGEGGGINSSPSRRGSKAAGRFQRRLAEASAEVAAESAAAPRIAIASAAGETETGDACLSGGGAVAAAGSLGREPTKVTKKNTWGDDQPPTAGDGGGGGQKRWTPGEDRRLERLVRECVFDFDLVAARFSSAGDVDGCGDGASRALTAEDCRVRFAQLDRDEGSADDESGDDQGAARDGDDGAVVYGVAAPGVLENSGLSFAELEHKARNMKSRFLEPPKELPSTKDDNDNVEDVGPGLDRDNKEASTSSHKILSSASRHHAGLSESSGGQHAVHGVAGVGGNEPDLIVVSSPAGAATTDHGHGHSHGKASRDRSRATRAGSESDSDGEDDEVLTRAQIKNMVAKKAQRHEAKH